MAHIVLYFLTTFQMILSFGNRTIFILGIRSWISDMPLIRISANFQLGRSLTAGDGWSFILAATTQAVA